MRFLGSFFGVLAVSIQLQAIVENCIIVTIDGVRTFEVFNGADKSLIDDPKYNHDAKETLEAKYNASTLHERRAKLMPFMWGTLAKKGQIFGNTKYGNKITCTNKDAFSYAGYNEMFAGFDDPAITTNEFGLNPHTTVLEFLNKQKKFKNKVAIFGAWTTFADIFNIARSKLYFVGPEQTQKSDSVQMNLIRSMLQDEIRPWGKQECSDVFIHYQAMEYLRTKKPRILYIAYGDTDNWAHEGWYNCYLEAIHRADAWLSQLWNFIQSDAQYKNKTMLLVTTDHGRGSKQNEWIEHDRPIAGSHDIWLAIVGPGVVAIGEVKKPMQLYQKQIAQTIAQSLGYTFEAQQEIAKPLIAKAQLPKKI